MSVTTTHHRPAGVTLARAARVGYGLLSGRERRRAALLGLSNVVNGALQTVALAAIVPLVQLMVEPDRVVRSRWLGLVAGWAGPSTPGRLLVAFGIAFWVLVVLKNAYGWLHLRWHHDFAADCEQRLASDLLGRVLDAPYHWAVRQNSSVLTEMILGNVVHWSRGFVKGGLQIVNDALFVAMTVALLLYASPAPGVVIAAAAAALAWILFRVTRPLTVRHAQTKQAAIRRAVVMGSQSIAGIKEVKMTGSEAFFTREFAGAFGTATRAHARMSLWQQVPRMGIEVIGFGAMMVVVIVTGTTRADALALVALYALAAVRVLPIVSNVVASLGALLGIAPLLDEVAALDRDTAWPRGEGADAPLFRGWRSVELDRVSYRYATRETEALQEVSLAFEQGRAYGLVGPSGAGKTTCVDLLATLLSPTSGTIRIDGVPLAPEHRKAWRQEIGYVSQSPFLLDATLRENVTFGLDAARVDEARLRRALELAHLDRLVAALPDGLETRVGERGVALSGGQRQRVAIARALYRNARLLIFDEATSALDSLSEQELTEAIGTLAGAVTMVIIAHRLGTVAHCDEIALFEGGRIVSTGSHGTLLRSSTLYRQLVDAQFGGLAAAVEEPGR